MHGQPDTPPDTVRPEPVEGLCAKGFDELSPNGDGVPDAATGAIVCAALRRQVEKLGLSLGDEPRWAEAAFETATDPFTQEVSVVACWRGKARFGKATFFPDGRVFAEYQVLLPHPNQADCYVDSVQIWGRPQHLRGEAVIAEYLK